MPAPSIDTLTERVEGVREDVRDLSLQLEAHRREATASAESMRESLAESTDATRAALEEIRKELVKSADMRDRQAALEETVNGKGDEPGLKGRQDRAEQRLALIFWFGAVIVAAVVTLVFDWISKHIGSGSAKVSALLDWIESHTGGHA